MTKRHNSFSDDVHIDMKEQRKDLFSLCRYVGSVEALRKVSSHWILKTIDFNHHYCFSIVWGFGYRTNSLRILGQLLHDPGTLLPLDMHFTPKWTQF